MKVPRVLCAMLAALLMSPLVATALAAPPTTAPANKPEVGQEVGKTAPDIKGKDVNGKAIKLSDFKGKVVVLDFFGDW
jgi:cytochrome oxidase Cu insertion factor (SCO1/SenC/PrrC family)